MSSNLKCQHDSIATCSPNFPQINMGQVIIFLLMALVVLGHACGGPKDYCEADDGTTCTGPCAGGGKDGAKKSWCYNTEKREWDYEANKEGDRAYCSKADHVNCYTSSKSHLDSSASLLTISLLVTSALTTAATAARRMY